MPKFELTSSQHEAVYTRGKPLLVSAAAGSGKTRVLTERLMARVMEGEDIDRFLIITFTRAAAAELRGRILTELNERSAAEPSNRRLRRQTALLYRAHIGTIDSFCASLLRENAHVLGLSPGFSVLEQERGQSLRRRALEEVLESAYEHIDEDPGLRALVDSAGAGRDDTKLGELILSIHDRMQSRAWPEMWAEEALSMLDLEGACDAGETPWGAWLLEDAAREAEYQAAALEEALAFMKGDEKMEAAYGPAYAEAALALRDIARAARDGQWDRAAGFAKAPWPKLKSLLKYEDEARKTYVKGFWDNAKKGREKIEKALAGQSARLLEGLWASKAPLKALMELVFRLDKAYALRKKRAEALDFSDVEHYCIQLLSTPEGQPTALARKLSGRFAEVMVDEYQDVNAVQDCIFHCLSGEGQKLFVVGDVKQSIYRFRLADPGIFLAKYAAFAADDHACRVLLQENFRSAAPVLAATNTVFDAILSKDLGDIDYDEEARLVCGAGGYPEELPKPELCVLDYAGDEEMPDKTLAEARYVAGRIRAMVDEGTLIQDGGARRPLRWGDIAILLRTPGSSGAAYRRALLEAGIPVNARQGSGFFEQAEIRFVLSMLAVIDNPRQDVPLIAALRSAPYGFSPEELTAIRAAAAGDLWDALLAKSEEDERCRRFAQTLRELRELSRELSTDALLQRLYDKTGLMALCCAMGDGENRVGRLMLLFEYARKFEQDGSRGLFRFVSWIKNLEARGEEPPAPARSGAVQILSIHKSKGLEYPVVFVADLAHRWRNAGGEAALSHSDFGLGLKVTDSEWGLSYPNLAWRAIAARQKQEELSEQMRVLYVAMTRAKERLILSCTLKKSEEKWAEYSAHAKSPVSPRLLAGADSMAPWLMRAAAADKGKTIRVRLVSPESEAKEAVSVPSVPAATEADEALVAALEERLAWRYPHAAAMALPSKLTATEAKRLTERPDGEAASLAPAPRQFRRPDFGKADRPLGGTERGIAAHLVMQHIDLSQTGSAEQIAAEIERLRFRGFLEPRQAEAVSPGDILAFFRSPLGQRVKEAEKIWREFRFSLLCPAADWFPEAPTGEEILLQGVIDLCILEKGKLTVIDFKTDAEVKPELYAGQLRSYALAMERITGLPVAGAELWYLRKKVQKSLAIREFLC